LPPSPYDAVISTLIHPNEIASQLFHEQLLREPLQNTRAITPNDFLGEHEHTTDSRYIRGANLGLQFPSCDEYRRSRQNPFPEDTVQHLAWNIREVFSQGFVGLDIHGGPVDGEDYVLLHPEAQYPIRALARFLLGEKGDINEGTPGTLSASATNTLVYEISGKPDVLRQKVGRLHQKLKTVLSSGMLPVIKGCHPNDGARYAYREVGTIDYPTARDTLIFWDKLLGNWRVIEPRLTKTTRDSIYTADGIPVVRLGDTVIAPNTLLPEGCEDIPGFFAYNNSTITPVPRTPILMTGCVPGGTEPHVATGTSFYAQVRTQSNIDHSIDTLHH